MSAKKIVLMVILAAIMMTSVSGCTGNGNSKSVSEEEISYYSYPEDSSEDEQDTDEEWLSVYREQMKKLDYTYTDQAAFDLLDMDGDGIPEIFYSEGTAHAAKVIIYTYRESKAEELLRAGEFGEVGYSAENGLIRDYYSNNGFTSEKFYKYENGGMKLVAHFESTINPTGEVSPYKVGGKVVEKEDYDKAVDEFNTKYPRKEDYRKLGRGTEKGTDLEEAVGKLTAVG